MKYCLKCKAEFFLSPCQNCGSAYEEINGFLSFSPELAYENDGFKAEYFSDLARSEDEHFWFVARNHIILWAIKKYCSLFESFMEIGCGTGFVLKGISETFPNTRLTGSEIFIEGLGFASDRIKNAKFIQMDARAIPFFEEFDAIGAFDVLEHIDDDIKVLNQISKALKPGGKLILTVPQHPWLWSQTDEIACHERRYTSAELHNKVKSAGFSIIRSTSFVSLLLPMMMVSRLLKGNKTSSSERETGLKLDSRINYIFYKIMRIEALAIRLGLNFTLGGSRLLVAQKL